MAVKRTAKSSKKLRSPQKIKTHKVAATAKEPQFIVETDNGKRAAHKPGALKK